MKINRKNPVNRQGEKISIGVVEDDKACLALYELVFFELGITAAYFATGEAALAALSTIDSPHLLFIDFQLPDMKGNELLTMIQAQHPALLKLTTVVGFSLHAKGSRFTHSFEQAVTIFYEKPTELSVFEGIIGHEVAKILNG